MDISFVIPCYCSSDTIGPVVDEIVQNVLKMGKFQYEIILVNDCSPDHGATIHTIRELCRNNSQIKGIDLAKNSGQAAATMAGFAQASGELIVVGDDDGQTPYEYISDMYQKIFDHDYDIVCANYTERGHRSMLRNIGSWLNAKMVYYTLEIPNNIVVSAYFIAKRFVVQEMLRYNNPYPYILGLITQVTHNIGNVEVAQRERRSGSSGYTMSKLLSMWLNGLTAFSVRPLRLSALAGFLCAVIGFGVGVVTIIRKLLHPEILAGYTTTLAVVLFIGGMIMLMLGLLGEYVGRIYISLNNRPQYVVKERINMDDPTREGVFK